MSNVWRRRLGIGATIIVFCWLLGALVDALPGSTLTYWSVFMVTSLGGVAYAAWLLSPLLKTRGQWLAYLALALIGWRIAYFPFMVFAGTFAAYIEWVQIALTGRTLFIYPSFLFSFCGLHLIVALALYLPLSKFRFWPLVVAPFFVQGLMVSFTSIEDLTILPDHTWKLSKPLPEITLPQSNPYLEHLEKGTTPLWCRLLPFAAGSTYDQIPGTPWARIVKGVLEAEFRATPSSTSHWRVEEHYYGYLLAHPTIGQRAPDADSPR